MAFQNNSLLERLLLGKRGYAPSRQANSAELMDSVLRNLGRIFNTNQGSSLARPDYGVPDFNQVISNFPDAVPRLAHIIEEQIRMFEPRLRSCKVRFVDDSSDRPKSGPISLDFVITAELAQSANEFIRFETVFADNGRFLVKP